jgi:hypothetical protein
MESESPSVGSRPAHWFKPGVSGNPGGRSKKSEAQRAVEVVTRAQAQAAIERLLGKALAAVEKSLRSKDEALALRAALEVLDRGIGKAMQRIEGTFTSGEPTTQVTPEMLRLAATRLLAASATDIESRP